MSAKRKRRIEYYNSIYTESDINQLVFKVESMNDRPKKARLMLLGFFAPVMMLAFVAAILLGLVGFAFTIFGMSIGFIISAAVVQFFLIKDEEIDNLLRTIRSVNHQSRQIENGSRLLTEIMNDLNNDRVTDAISKLDNFGYTGNEHDLAVRMIQIAKLDDQQTGIVKLHFQNHRLEE